MVLNSRNHIVFTQEGVETSDLQIMVPQSTRSEEDSENRLRNRAGSKTNTRSQKPQGTERCRSEIRDEDSDVPEEGPTDT